MNRIAAWVLLLPLLCSVVRAETSKSAPSFVVKLADAHIESLESKPDNLDEARKRFCAMFRMGYTSFAETEIRDDSLPLEFAGYNAAVRYRMKHPESLDRVFTAFGYKKVIRTGMWRTGFEMSQFVNEKVPKPGWWIGYFPNCEEGNLIWKRFPKLPADRDIPAKLRELIDNGRGAEAKVRVTGYLSPVGEYGHLGSYSREFLATNIQPTDRPMNQPAPATTHNAGTQKGGDAYRSYDGQPHPTEGTNEPSDAPKDRASRNDNGNHNAGPR